MVDIAEQDIHIDIEPAYQTGDHRFVGAGTDEGQT